MKYVISTQYLENYGAHSCEPGTTGTYADNQHYWKFKSGTDYIVTGLDREADAVAFVSAYLHKNNSIGVKEFPTYWRTYTEWRDDLNIADAKYVNAVLKAAVCIDPRGEQVADLLESDLSSFT